MMDEMQKLIMKKKIKKYVQKYVAKYQPTGTSYSNSGYYDTQYPPEEEEPEEEAEYEEEPQQKQVRFAQPKNRNTLLKSTPPPNSKLAQILGYR
jgi:hypothetical protein